jgi:hypothetical protein
LPQILKKFSDIKFGEEEDSSSKKTETKFNYPELEKALQEAEKKIYYIKK